MLPQLVALSIFAGTADFVLGSRSLGKRDPGAMPFVAVFGNRLSCFLMRWLFADAQFTDLGPFSGDFIRQIGCELSMSDTNFGWTIEMQIKATRAGLVCREIPVPYRCRVGQSKISGTIYWRHQGGNENPVDDRPIRFLPNPREGFAMSESLALGSDIDEFLCVGTRSHLGVYSGDSRVWCSVGVFSWICYLGIAFDSLRSLHESQFTRPRPDLSTAGHCSAWRLDFISWHFAAPIHA